MKKMLALLTGWLTVARSATACPACEKQQPKLLRGITHGSGPGSDWDYVLIAAIVIIVMLTLIYSIKFLIKPGEQSRDHIKRSILNYE